MSELNDSSDLQKYSTAVLYVLSAVDSTPDYVHVIADHFLNAIKSSDVSKPRYEKSPSVADYTIV